MPRQTCCIYIWEKADGGVCLSTNFDPPVQRTSDANGSANSVETTVTRMLAVVKDSVLEIHQ